MVLRSGVTHGRLLGGPRNTRNPQFLKHRRYPLQYGHIRDIEQIDGRVDSNIECS